LSAPTSFFGHDPTSLRTWCADHGLPGFAADQIIDWVYTKGVSDPAAMSNLSKDHRMLIAETLPILEGSEARRQVASDGTRKLLLEWPDGSGRAASTETVLIPAETRRTACVSSQIGCPVRCTFCASGMEGLDGNLTASRIVEQAWRLGQLGDGRVTNVVFMGMGEPLANFSAVAGAITTLNAPWGLGIGARRITVSTVGLPKAIRRLIAFPIPVTLALSLHAPEDALRRQLIPWAQFATIGEILAACSDYFEATGREITLEYLLLRGVNDRVHHAKQLAEIATTLRCNINLIRYNAVEGLPFERPLDEDVHAFQATLRSRRINVHIRASRGRDITAACGQLRRETAVQVTREGGDGESPAEAKPG
jgi:23S rRNA (adenine2503-C2)-methyltransferase